MDIWLGAVLGKALKARQGKPVRHFLLWICKLGASFVINTRSTDGLCQGLPLLIVSHLVLKMLLLVVWLACQAKGQSPQIYGMTAVMQAAVHIPCCPSFAWNPLKWRGREQAPFM